MEQFTLSKDCYDAIQMLKKTKDKEAVSLSIFQFMFEDKEPEGLSEVADFAFQMILPKLLKSKNNSGRGGRPKNENRLKTDLKPIENRLKTDLKTDFQKESSSPLKESNKENNTSNYKEKYNPPFLYPPKSGDKSKKNDKDLFLEKYTRYEGFTCDDSGIDYKVLLEEFDKSTYLRSLYTFKQVVSIYTAITKGEFRDKEKKTEASPADSRAERERWYSQRKQAAEAEADKKRTAVTKKFKKFADLEKAYKAAELEVVRCEIAFNNSIDGFDSGMLEAAVMEKERIEDEIRSCLDNCGLTKEDLLPKWHCEKCQDTGWQEDGSVCDCYAKEKEA